MANTSEVETINIDEVKPTADDIFDNGYKQGFEDAQAQRVLDIVEIRSWGTNDFPGAIMEAWNSGDEDFIVTTGKKLLALSKMISEAKTHYDTLVDRKATFGSDKFTSVVRLRAKSDKVGRPRTEKKDDLLNSLLG